MYQQEVSDQEQTNISLNTSEKQTGQRGFEVTALDFLPFVEQPLAAFHVLN